MKHILTLLLLTLSLSLSAQKSFEGTLTFQISFLNTSPEMEMAKAVMPTSFILKMKGDNTRLTTVGGMMSAMFGDVVAQEGGKTTFFLNDAAKTVTMVGEDQQMKDAEASDFEVKEGSDNRTILGYACKHYIVVSKVDASVTTEFWVAPELSTAVGRSSSSGMLVQSSLYGIKGLALRSLVGNPQMTMVIEASAITPEILPSSIFEMPKNYKVIESMPAMFDFGGGNDR